MTWGVPLSVSYHVGFSCCSWGSQGKNTDVICHSLLQWTTFCQTSPPWPVCLGWPHMAWLRFIELEKTVVHVIRFASYLGCGVSLHGCSIKGQLLLLTLDEGYLPIGDVNTVLPQTMWILGVPTIPKPVHNFWLPQNLITNNLLLTGSLTKNMKSQLTHILYVLYTYIYTYIYMYIYILYS